jgi:hypothetical protein
MFSCDYRCIKCSDNPFCMTQVASGRCGVEPVLAFFYSSSACPHWRECFQESSLRTKTNSDFIVAADGQCLRAETEPASAFNRACRHSGRTERIDLDRAAGVRNQSRLASRRRIEEAHRATVIGHERSRAASAAVEEIDLGAVGGGDGGIARGAGVVELDRAELRARRIVRDAGVAGGGAAGEDDEASGVGDGGVSGAVLEPVKVMLLPKPLFTMVAWSAVLVSLKLRIPPKLSICAVPALPSPLKLMLAKPLLVMEAFPAVLAPLKLMVAELELRMVASPALAPVLKSIVLLLKMLALPALALV